MDWTRSFRDEPFVDLGHYAVIGSKSTHHVDNYSVLRIVILIVALRAVKTKIPSGRDALDEVKLRVE